jgi:two-component sensor histidine kinase
MHVSQSPRTDPSAKTPALVLGEFNHRIRNLLQTIEAVVRDTESTSVEDYRTTLIASISGLASLHAASGQSHRGRRRFVEMLEQTLRPHTASGARVLAAGPDFDLEPNLAFALHLVFHELAANARKYGALSSPSGCVTVEWKFRQAPGAAHKLAIAWTEHGGPRVKPPRHQGFGSRLIKKALEEYGAVRWNFDPLGLAFFMLIGLNESRASERRSSHEN